MEQALRQAAVSTFEELGFVFAAESNDVSSINPKQSLRVTVGFNGPFAGDLVVQIENVALSTIASNMLGEDGPVGEEMARDVLGELANVICGNALPNIAGKLEVFKLMAPDFEALHESERAPSIVVRMVTDEGRADIFLYLK